MIKRIVIHATDTPSGQRLTLEDIEELNSADRHSDPMPYHYVINTDGTILKGRHDNELCGHCGKFSRDSISVAYAGGLLLGTLERHDTLTKTQNESLRLVIRNLLKRHH